MVMLKGGSSLPYGIAMTTSNVYWTDWKKWGYLFRASKPYHIYPSGPAFIAQSSLLERGQSLSNMSCKALADLLD